LFKPDILGNSNSESDTYQEHDKGMIVYLMNKISCTSIVSSSTNNNDSKKGKESEKLKYAYVKIYKNVYVKILYNIYINIRLVSPSVLLLDQPTFPSSCTSPSSSPVLMLSQLKLDLASSEFDGPSKSSLYTYPQLSSKYNFNWTCDIDSPDVSINDLLIYIYVYVYSLFYIYFLG
jgi:hypothetical protein